EHAKWLAYLRNVESTIYTVNAVRKRHHLVPVEGDVGTGGPLQPPIRISGVYRELMTPEADLADVVIVVAKSGFLWNLYAIQQVGGCFVIIIIHKLDSIIKQT